MSFRIRARSDPPSTKPVIASPKTLQRIESQVELLLGQHSHLELYKRSIERQLALITAHIREENVPLIPCKVFLLLELRGSGGVCASLEQIARILCEVGYWKPRVSAWNYRPQDVYHLGRSAQKLFDDCTAIGRKVKQLQAQVE